MAACPVGRVPPDMRKDGYFMKSMKRRLLSLFMAMVMVCSLVPVALAAGESVTINDVSNAKAGEEITISANVTGFDSTASLTYAWSASGCGLTNATGSDTTFKVTPTAAGTLTVNLSVTPAGGTAVNATAKSITVAAADTPISLGTISGNTKITYGGTTGNTTTLSVTVNGTGADASKVSWSASPNSSAVTLGNPSHSGTTSSVVVTAGQVTSETKVTITAKYDNDANKTATTEVTVTPAAPQYTISLSPVTASVEVNKPLALTVQKSVNAPADATVAFEPTAGVTANNGSYTFTSATAGTYKIKALLKQGSTTLATSNEITITVTQPQISGTITPSTTAPTSGGTITFKFTANAGSTLENGDTVHWSSSNTDILTFSTSSATFSDNESTPVSARVISSGSVTVTAEVRSFTGQSKGTTTSTITVSGPLTLSSNRTNGTLTSPGDYLTLSAFFNSGIANGTALTWRVVSGADYVTVTKGNSNTATVTALKATPSNTTATIRATYDNGGGETFTADYNVKVSYSANLTPSVVVYDSNPGYGLDDIPDEGNTSIVSQLDSQVRSKIGNSRYDYYKLRFGSVGNSRDDGYLDANTRTDYYNDELEDIVFYPTANLTSSNSTATETFEFSVEVYNSSNSKVATLSGLMTFTIKRGDSVGSGDIVYSASLGQDVSFDVSDFEDFYSDKYSRGYLEYVTFGSSTANGTLYNEDGKSAGSSSYYVDPSSRQKGLDGIYFSPKSSMKRSTTVKISFTAYGTTRDNSGEGKAEGTVTIIYLNDSAKDITYNTTAGKVTLSAQDFIDAYKEATGSKTAPSNLTIEFQNVPSNGTLTYTGGSKDKDLTKSNVKSNRYTTKNSGSYRLAQLTYTGTKGKDTIDYIAYSGSTAQFTGKVVFNGTAAVPTDVVVTYGSTGGQAVRFSQNDFVSANSAMSKATKVRFVAPANGTLLMNGANASGVDIATTLLGTVTYQPKSGFNGQDKIIFAAYDASNNTVASGTVNITVIGNPTTGTTPGGTPGGVSDVSQFKDVSATAWYRDNLATLVRKGIITGKGEGKFDPLGTVTYGEALKMVLESCGYTAALGTGSNWAINYKNLAVSRGWISSDIDLNAAISRNATAELTAKVLGVSAVTSGSPFADEANGYAAALYYTSPQIFAGSPNPNGGKPLFKNSSPLLRQEVCAVICRVSDYHTQHTTNNMPDGI